MHPTANSVAFIRKTQCLFLLNARRVMPGVRPLREYKAVVRLG